MPETESLLKGSSLLTPTRSVPPLRIFVVSLTLSVVAALCTALLLSVPVYYVHGFAGEAGSAFRTTAAIAVHLLLCAVIILFPLIAWLYATIAHGWKRAVRTVSSSGGALAGAASLIPCIMWFHPIQAWHAGPIGYFELALAVNLATMICGALSVSLAVTLIVRTVRSQDAARSKLSAGRLPRWIPRLLGGAAGAALLTMLGAKMREAILFEECADHLLQIYGLCHTYAEEHEKTFPPDLSVLLATYGRVDLLRCPARHGGGSGSDYLYFPRAAGRPGMVLACDKPGNHGRQGYNIVSFDGGSPVRWTASLPETDSAAIYTVIVPGRLALTNPNGLYGSFFEDLPLLRSKGVAAIVLLEEGPVDNAAVGRADIECLREPVAHFCAPSIVQLERIMAFITRQGQQGRMVLVHCHAGLGRSRVVAAAYLVRCGYDPTAAIARVRELNTELREGEQLFETVQQEEAVNGYAVWLKTGRPVPAVEARPTMPGAEASKNGKNNAGEGREVLKGDGK